MADLKQRRIAELERRYQQGSLSRRDFLRAAALLGLTLGASEVLSACSRQPGWVATPGGGEDLSRDPIEDLYHIDYITTTPVGSSTSASGSAGASPATAIPPAEKQIQWFCSCCGQRFRTIDDLRKHAVAEHGWRLPDIQRVDQPTYTEFLTSEVARFNERNTVFSRTWWDKPYQALVQEASAKAPPGDLEYFEGMALVAGAIYVDATAGALHPGYYGYSGHVREVGGLYSWDDPVNPDQYPVSDAQWMSERVKQAARFYGADLVGITRIDPRWVYSHYFELATGNSGSLEIPYQYAIVMGIEMDWRGITESPRPFASAATALAYSQMAELSASLAKYIRSLGYEAIPCGNDSAQSIPLAIDAGLGELGRNGLMLSPEYGPRQRLCKVLTNLPLVPDKPIDFGIRRFCETCHACAAACPVDAIRWEDRTTETTSISNRPGILRWPVNVSKCYLFWRENGVDCSNCVAACPWGLHSQRDWLEL